ncbi:MAG: hypothetical protein AAFR44_05650 [Pseudomonadota bacterium]
MRDLGRLIRRRSLSPFLLFMAFWLALCAGQAAHALTLTLETEVDARPLSGAAEAALTGTARFGAPIEGTGGARLLETLEIGFLGTTATVEASGAAGSLTTGAGVSGLFFNATDDSLDIATNQPGQGPFAGYRFAAITIWLPGASTPGEVSDTAGRLLLNLLDPDGERWRLTAAFGAGSVGLGPDTPRAPLSLEAEPPIPAVPLPAAGPMLLAALLAAGALSRRRAGGPRRSPNAPWPDRGHRRPHRAQ